KEHERVGHRGNDRGPPEAERAPLRGLQARQRRRSPREAETEHVAEIVPGVGEQRDRVRQDPVDDLDDDKREVQPDADREGAPVAYRPVRVPVMVVAVPAYARELRSLAFGVSGGGSAGMGGAMRVGSAGGMRVAARV